jgi:serine/threonine protein kinase
MVDEPRDKVDRTEESPTEESASQMAGSDVASGNDTDHRGTRSSTGIAPSFRSLISTTEFKRLSWPPPDLPQLGEKYADFELVRVLGTGAFGKVFLARQLSLDRHVALKISANRGSEARTLASLEHDHIVHVFSELIDKERNVRLLCMQYVPGTTLSGIIQQLRQRDPRDWTGRLILEAIDDLSTLPATLDPAALHGRELLGSYDFVEAVCYIGSCLARALAHAHGQHVLHRDVKPANILLNQYGRPMLADFNLAHDMVRIDNLAEEIFGGTLAYMAPEHLDAFNPAAAVSAEVVDARSDIYSLGVVLYELLSGRLPFRHVPHRAEEQQALSNMAAERRGSIPPMNLQFQGGDTLERVIRRCLSPEPNRRYQTASDLCAGLEGCLELRCIEKELPRLGRLARTVTRRPFLWMAVLALLPHVLGSVVNISYNMLRIGPSLSSAQQTTFERTILVYNLIVYTLCSWLLFRLFVPVVRAWRRVTGPDLIESSEADSLRQQILRLPRWAAILSIVGWIPGGFVFPLAVHYFSDPVSVEVFGHFLISFTISGLIALTYAVFAVQYVVLRVLYPRLWGDGQDLRRKAGDELRGIDLHLRLLQLLAGLIPLAGAILMIGVGPDPSQFTAARYWEFRILATGLIVVGMAGLTTAQTASSVLSRTLTVLVGAERQRRTVSPSVKAARKKEPSAGRQSE